MLYLTHSPHVWRNIRLIKRSKPPVPLRLMRMTTRQVVCLKVTYLNLQNDVSPVIAVAELLPLRVSSLFCLLATYTLLCDQLEGRPTYTSIFFQLWWRQNLSSSNALSVHVHIFQELYATFLMVYLCSIQLLKPNVPYVVMEHL